MGFDQAFGGRQTPELDVVVYPLCGAEESESRRRGGRRRAIPALTAGPGR
jgi:hypothetical protein